MSPARKKMAAARVRLLSRYKKVIQEWPVDTSRKGRDLGEHLKHSYNTKFEITLDKDVSYY